MTLYFINGSHQQKYLVESDYIEDIIDIIIDFFESHNSFPHMLTVRREKEDIRIAMANTREHFRITNVSAEGELALTEWIEG